MTLSLKKGLWRLYLHLKMAWYSFIIVSPNLQHRTYIVSCKIGILNFLSWDNVKMKIEIYKLVEAKMAHFWNTSCVGIFNFQSFIFIFSVFKNLQLFKKASDYQASPLLQTLVVLVTVFHGHLFLVDWIVKRISFHNILAKRELQEARKDAGNFQQDNSGEVVEVKMSRSQSWSSRFCACSGASGILKFS